MERIKKKQILIYKFKDKEIELKVICKEILGDELVARCKIVTKDWYEKEVYVTKNDLYSGKIKILEHP
jgi:hypothetical protein